ncbi:MAG: hypothetical protein QM726_08845 [Chitinophagaceae bacterium]
MIRLLKYLSAKKKKAAAMQKRTVPEVKYNSNNNEPGSASLSHHQVNISGSFTKNFVAN